MGKEETVKVGIEALKNQAMSEDGSLSTVEPNFKIAAFPNSTNQNMST
jgi:hypothetical protein